MDVDNERVAFMHICLMSDLKERMYFEKNIICMRM